MSGWAPTVAAAVGPTNDSHAAMTFLCDLVIATPDAEFGSMVNSDETFSSANAAARGDIDVLVKGIEEAVSTLNTTTGMMTSRISHPAILRQSLNQSV